VRLRVALVLLLAACVLAPALAAPPRPRVAIFFYPWYGTPAHDGEWEHWTQNGATPPRVIASNFYPIRGAYSSADTRVLAAQMRDIAGAGVDEVVTSWWGRGSREDERLPQIIAAARARGLSVAVHLEPYPKRTAQTVQADLRYVAGLGVRDVFVYVAEAVPAEDWTRVLPMRGVRVFAHTRLVGWAKRAHFQGVYTFDAAPTIFRRACVQAHRAHLACAPTVSPGFDARRSTGNVHVQPRRNGATYDTRWRAAACARADVVTISSYNEWHEGTQIEPATSSPPGGRMYQTYNGAYGEHGRAAQRAYLVRTRYWTKRFDAGSACR
jgi:glycoprotein endo-alpha-1,2-mannosidase